MKTINGKYYYQVKDLLEDLKEFSPEAIVYADSRRIYRTVESADEKDVHLYTSQDE